MLAAGQNGALDLTLLRSVETFHPSSLLGFVEYKIIFYSATA